MGRETSDQPSSGSPERWSSILDGSAPIPLSYGASLEPTPVSVPVTPNTVVHHYVPEVAVHVLDDHKRRETEVAADSTMHWQSFAVRDQSLIDYIRAAPTAYIVTVRISVETPRADGQHEWLVVERKALCGPVDRSDWSVLLPKSAGKDWKADDSAAREWSEAFNRWAAKIMVDPIWERSTDRWNIRDMASIADGLGRLQDQYHEVTLGQPVEFAGQLVGLNPLIGAVLKGVVTERELPGDSLLTDLKRTVQIIGIGAGFASGNLYLAHAYMGSLGKDLAMDAVSRELARLSRRHQFQK